jgi:hypothetical protein
MQEAIFKLTPEMEQEINDEISKLAPNVQEPHDLSGERPRAVSLRRRPVGVADSGGAAPRPEDDLAMSETEDLLSTRRQTHGNFRDNARLSQRLKSIFRSTASWDHLDDVEKESLDMIALKISRILSGKSLEKQHWEDVKGYAALAEKECMA